MSLYSLLPWPINYVHMQSVSSMFDTRFVVSVSLSRSWGTGSSYTPYYTNCFFMDLAGGVLNSKTGEAHTCVHILISCIHSTTKDAFKRHYKDVLL